MAHNPDESSTAFPSARPRWVTWLDRLALVGTRAADRLVERPTEALLASLAEADRPCPPIPMPDLPGFDARGHLGDGRNAFAAGHYGEALHHFGLLIQADPENPWGWHGRGDALQLLGSHQDSLDAYDRAIALAPERGLHHGARANALISMGRPEEAERAWAHALELDPSLTWMRSSR